MQFPRTVGLFRWYAVRTFLFLSGILGEVGVPQVVVHLAGGVLLHVALSPLGTVGVAKQDVGTLVDDGLGVLLISSHRLSRTGGSGLHDLDGSFLGGAGPPAIGAGDEGGVQDGVLGVLLDLPAADVVLALGVLTDINMRTAVQNHQFHLQTNGLHGGDNGHGGIIEGAGGSDQIFDGSTVIVGGLHVSLGLGLVLHVPLAGIHQHGVVISSALLNDRGGYQRIAEEFGDAAADGQHDGIHIDDGADCLTDVDIVNRAVAVGLVQVEEDTMGPGGAGRTEFQALSQCSFTHLALDNGDIIFTGEHGGGAGRSISVQLEGDGIQIALGFLGNAHSILVGDGHILVVADQSELFLDPCRELVGAGADGVLDHVQAGSSAAHHQTEGLHLTAGDGGLGYYNTIIDTISTFITAVFSLDIPGALEAAGILVPFGIGVVLGILGIAKLIEVLLAKFEKQTYHAILGLVLASPFSILMNAAGGALGIGMILGCVVTFAGGFALAFGLSKK